MDHDAGTDVSPTTISVCVLDATGRIVRKAKVASEPEALVAFLAGCGPHPARVGRQHRRRAALAQPAAPIRQWACLQPLPRWQRHGERVERSCPLPGCQPDRLKGCNGRRAVTTRPKAARPLSGAAAGKAAERRQATPSSSQPWADIRTDFCTA